MCKMLRPNCAMFPFPCPDKYSFVPSFRLRPTSSDSKVLFPKGKAPESAIFTRCRYRKPHRKVPTRVPINFPLQGWAAHVYEFPYKIFCEGIHKDGRYSLLFIASFWSADFWLLNLLRKQSEQQRKRFRRKWCLLSVCLCHVLTPLGMSVACGVF